MTVREWRDSIARSKPCLDCGYRLLELTEDGPMCPRCHRMYKPEDLR